MKYGERLKMLLLVMMLVGWVGVEQVDAAWDGFAWDGEKRITDLITAGAINADSLAVYGVYLDSLVTVSIRVDSLIIKKDSGDYGVVGTYNDSTGVMDIEVF